MKPVFQRENANSMFASAWSACVATILEVEANEIPIFIGPNWVHEANSWLAHWYGVFFIEYPAFPPPEYRELGADFYHIVVGPSPHEPGGEHAVVGRSGKIVHDPHPSGLKLLNGQWMHAVLVRTFNPTKVS